MKKSILATILVAGALFVNSGSASAATVVYLDGTVSQVPDAVVIGNPNFTLNFDGTYSSTYELTSGKPSVGTLDPATAAKYLPGFSNNSTPQPVEAPVSQPAESSAPVSQPVEAPISQPVEAPVSKPVETQNSSPVTTPQSSSVENVQNSSEVKTETKPSTTEKTEVKPSTTVTKSEVTKSSTTPAKTEAKKSDNLPKTNDASILAPILGVVVLAASGTAHLFHKKNK